jgi:hypothetical protein
MTSSSRSSFFINCSRSGNYERNPNYFYRPEEYNHVPSYEYKSKYFNPKNGYSKFQAKSPGENDKEVIELFRKIKAQLREKAMSKKDGNIKDSSRRPKKDISSLLEVLEKHSNPVTDKSKHTKVYKREPLPTNVARVNQTQTVDSKEREIEAEPVLLDKSIFEEIFDDEENDGDDENRDFSAMKITELKSLAKSRGLKGFSKLTKSELVKFLSD